MRTGAIIRRVNNKSMNQLMGRAVKQGWTITYTGGGHLAWRAPNGGKVIFSSSTPAAGVLKRHLKMMKEAGYKE